MFKGSALARVCTSSKSAYISNTLVSQTLPYQDICLYLQSDIQNDGLLAFADIMFLGTVNFNRAIPDIIKGDVYPNPAELERIQSANEKVS